MADKVLVTGGAGFVGSHLVHALIAKGYDVTVLDNLFRGRLEYIHELVKNEQVRFIKGDIRDADMVKDATKGVSYVIHKAAVCINYSLANPTESIDINVNGTYNVLRAARDEKVKKLVFASSASVYGNPLKLPMSEDSSLNPITPYCISKMAGENMLRMKGLEGLRSIALRYFNIYGPRQSIDAYYTSVIVSFIKRIMAGLPPRIIGDGKQSMDFVNVHDVVDVDIAAMENPDLDAGQVFNVGSGKSYSVNELARLLLKAAESPLKPEHIQGEKSIVQRRQADITRALKSFGFSPKVTLGEGMAEVVEDILKNPSWY